MTSREQSESGERGATRMGARYQELSTDDREVLNRYESFEDKGSPARGYRLTILSGKLDAKVEEPVRVVHVCESLSPEAPLYVMGPKTVWGEYVDGVLTTEPPPPGEDPFTPSAYDGRVLDGPGIDTNYEVTEYVFGSPGVHRVQWRLEPSVSNTLTIVVER